MNYFLYGVALVAFGIYRMIQERREGKARDQLHAHKCWQCGEVWQHTGAQADADPDSHNCPKCGVMQFRVFHDPPKIKSPVTVAGGAPAASGGNGAAPVQPNSDGRADLGRERPAPSPKDRDTADHGAGRALPKP